ncbi:hypothetical protein ACVXHB_28890 [Escherichia coli]
MSARDQADHVTLVEVRRRRDVDAVFRSVCHFRRGRAGVLRVVRVAILARRRAGGRSGKVLYRAEQEGIPIRSSQ